ncbi:MAG TPA: invasion associated locus B family protein [Micropepsaceae bacterium]|jgi:invasion protein IalB|nr:invasion associated locus B family protein [Micropepsaceae bacterium]
MHLKALANALLFAAIFAGTAMAAEEKPTLLGSFRDWHVYQTGKGANRLCYALSQPTQTSPKDAKRDSPFFLISTWPGRKVRNEPSVVPGYQYKDGAMTDVQIGSDKFTFFTKNDGSAGGAWMEDPKEEKRLVDTMKKGAGMNITGISSRGTMTHDTYSLAGISAALDKLESSCK